MKIDHHHDSITTRVLGHTRAVDHQLGLLEIEMSNDITMRVNELVAAGYGKTLIEGMLRAEGFTKADISAANVPSKKADENDAMAIMQMVIDLADEKLNNKQKAERIASQGLCTEKTAYHIMSLMKYVEAYHELMSA